VLKYYLYLDSLTILANKEIQFTAKKQVGLYQTKTHEISF